MKIRVVLVVSTLTVATAVFVPRIAVAQATISGCALFPTNNIWNVPVDQLPLDTNSAAYVTTIGTGAFVHADFGSGLWDGGPIGIPYVAVDATQPLVNVTFDYSDESDPGPYPIPTNAPIEGGPKSTGDRHVIVVDDSRCVLYELYDAHPEGGGSWRAIFDLNSNTLRPAGWTSADAAGLPILPGLVTYDEVASGEIHHAIRFTAPQTRQAYVWPARHYASSLTGLQYPPMGQRFRLKADFDISSYAPTNQVILQALKTYGMILADNGSSWYLSGVPDDRWDNDMLHELGQVPGSAFEAVDVSSLMLNPDSGQTSGTVPSPLPPADPVITLDDNDPSFQYAGKWKTKKQRAAFGGSYHIASTAGATVQFSFTGPGFTWLSARGKSYGAAVVLVDGLSTTNVDLYSRTNQFIYPVTVTGLTNGLHDVEILVRGTRDAKPFEKQIVFDGLTVP